MTGPWPSKADVNVTVGKARLECISKDDMRGTEFIAKLRNQDGGYGKSVHKICDWYSNPTITYTTRIDANGVKWWGCNATLKVRDKAPARSQDWYFNVWGSDNAWGADTTLNFQTIVSYCHDHRTWCQNHPSKVAISWRALGLSASLQGDTGACARPGEGPIRSAATHEQPRTAAWPGSFSV